MKLFLFLLAATTIVQAGSDTTGPRFDTDGHMVKYSYADGTHESYGYDSQWRMNRFVDRKGGVTTFVYRSDGSMSVVKPDGSTSR